MKKLKSILGVGLVFVIILTFTFVFAKGPQTGIRQNAQNTRTVSEQQRNVGCGVGLGLHINMQELVAKALGISVDDLTQKMQNGQTINDILTEKKMTLDEFKKKLYDLKVAEIDKLLKDGKITKEQANLIKQHIQTNIQNCIDNIANWSNNGFGYGGMMGFGHSNMMGGGFRGMMGY